MPKPNRRRLIEYANRQYFQFTVLGEPKFHDVWLDEKKFVDPVVAHLREGLWTTKGRNHFTDRAGNKFHQASNVKDPQHPDLAGWKFGVLNVGGPKNAYRLTAYYNLELKKVILHRAFTSDHKANKHYAPDFSFLETVLPRIGEMANYSMASSSQS
eukprot:GDKH01022102.1.p1 GENE.GDKH01022102.1~~GDKH01022102.1.p1  ORF type:complete len:156 (+),score=30.76 GDKH01022102.1:178-645(+)